MGLLDKVKETAQKGADLAKEGVKAGQDKLDEQKLKKKISDLKEELGGVVYDADEPAHRRGSSTPRSRSPASSPRSTRPRPSWPRVQAAAPTAPTAPRPPVASSDV